LNRVTHWIDGKSWSGTAERTGQVFDPATGQVTAAVDFAEQSEVEAAVSAASEAFPAWRGTSLAKRTAILFNFRELLASSVVELAAIVSAEHGKVPSDAAGEVSRGLEVVEFACGIAHLLKGEISEDVSSSVDAYSLRQPLGVVAGITPFNFPAMVPMWMFPLAIACGNTFVLKPSEKDPSASIFLASRLAEAGLPEGVFNVLHGDKVAVDGLLSHPQVAAVSFVGSTPIARYVYATAASHGKRVQALGGAKNHMVVMPDADLDAAADAAVSAAYGSSGERCMAISTVVAVAGAGDALVDRIRDRARRVRVGRASEPDSEMGPLITAAHRDKVTSYLDAGVNAGATLVLDGREHPIEGDPSGYWLGPTLFDRVTPDMSVYTDEIFGPVLSVLRVDTLEEALELIAASPFGNGAAIFTTDGAAARQFQHEAEAGMVGINVPVPVPVSQFSFGGWGNSLFGDLHVYGPDGVRFYTRAKAVTSRWTNTAKAGANLVFPTYD
jgi:malonate-semialdehyde dehydrogenase (acetylating)/methylmalonate-semialdehyde dehydrogenase